MDLVYSQAEISMVAACGSDANCGLAGVNRPRSEPLRKREDKQSASIRLELAGTEINSGTWSTRAWTFQEGRLSRRLLCFMDRQCYWECRSIHCVENLRYGPRVWKNPHLVSKLHGRLKFGPLSHFSNLYAMNEKPARYMEAACKLLAEYSQRELSFDEDAIFAILGVLKAVGKESLQIEENIYRPSAILGLPLVLGRKNCTSQLHWWKIA